MLISCLFLQIHRSFVDQHGIALEPDWCRFAAPAYHDLATGQPYIDSLVEQAEVLPSVQHFAADGMALGAFLSGVFATPAASGRW